MHSAPCGLGKIRLRVTGHAGQLPALCGHRPLPSGTLQGLVRNGHGRMEARQTWHARKDISPSQSVHIGKLRFPCCSGTVPETDRSPVKGRWKYLRQALQDASALHPRSMEQASAFSKPAKEFPALRTSRKAVSLESAQIYLPRPSGENSDKPGIAEIPPRPDSWNPPKSETGPHLTPSLFSSRW